MTIPSTAKKFSEPMDPKDVVDFVVDLTPLLGPGEQFATISFAVMPESAALGFQIKSGGGYDPVEIDDSHVRLWLGVAPGNQSDPVWDAAGTTCAIEATAVTNNVPARTYQRTFAVQVVQR